MHRLERPLAGLRVVDLTRLLPGPFATLLLGDLGADVVKVEEPGTGDATRWFLPSVGPGGLGAVFASLHRNKRSVVLDLKRPEGRAALAAVLAHADVLVESFRPGVLARLGFAPERLAADYPRLVVCALSGYGQTGPALAEAGHDLDFVARAGLLHPTGLTDGRLALPGFQVADVSAGLYAAAAVLAALLQRERTGRGAHVDLSMTESALSFLLPALGALAAGARYVGAGEDILNGGWPCYGVYPTRDGEWMALAALEPKFWLRFCAVAGCAHLATRGHAAGADGRAVQRELDALFRTRTRDEWVAALAGTDCCCVAVRRPDELTDDPLFRARDVFFAIEHPTLGALQQTATPLTPADRGGFRPPPLLGEHTAEVLREVGLTESEIRSLRVPAATAPPSDG